MIDNRTGRIKKAPVVLLTALVLVVFIVAVALNTKNTNDLENIIQDSIKSQLVSVSIASREMLDIDAFYLYDSPEEVEEDKERYDETLAALRALADNVGAKYIYALKEIDGEYYFVFDTDPETKEIFLTYDISPVHEAAFKGVNSADVMNVEDEWGSFNTGAVPIYRNGKIIGVISVDFEDAFLVQSHATSTRNSIIFIVTLLVVLTALVAFLIFLLRKVGKMQEKFRHLAHNDMITGLPNRQYLFEYLNNHIENKKDVPFALVFIDLDNFKTVNDQAGHDAGDELLKRIADFLQQTGDSNSKTFHPSPGLLNVSARVGGDEFIQIVPGAATVEDATKIADNLFTQFVPRKISRYIEKYNVGLSVGIALYPYHSENYHVLIKYADTAMYKAKKSGKNRCFIYADEINPEVEVSEVY